MLQSLLDSGGMGEVYRAEDVRLHGTVAVKVLSPGVATPDRVERLGRQKGSTPDHQPTVI